MSTLKPKPFSVDLKCNFCVKLLNFDLNNSTPSVRAEIKFVINREKSMKNSVKVCLKLKEYNKIYQEWKKYEKVG